LHKLHDELKYDGLEALQKGIAKDCDDARAYFKTLKTRSEPPLSRI
jgi:riboflavin kinase / FMN adenylyltransferase